MNTFIASFSNLITISKLGNTKNFIKCIEIRFGFKFFYLLGSTIPSIWESFIYIKKSEYVPFWTSHLLNIYLNEGLIVPIHIITSWLYWTFSSVFYVDSQRCCIDLRLFTERCLIWEFTWFKKTLRNFV